MKSRFRFHLCCVCMLVLAIAGCKVKRPDDVISESKMENLLYDYHLAKSMGDNLLIVRIIRRLCSRCRFQKIWYDRSRIRFVFGVVHTQHGGIIENL